MPGQPFGTRAFAVLLLAGAGSLVALPLADQATLGEERTGPFASLAPAAFDATLAEGALTVAGHTASTAHDEAIRAALGTAPAVSDLAAGILLPEYWQAGTLALLHAVRGLDAGSGALTPDGITLRGVTTTPARFEVRLATLRAALPADVELTDEVLRIDNSESLPALCARAFTGLPEASIEFGLASTELRPSAHALLDKLVEFLFDCPGHRLRVMGHSDASGDEGLNRRLSGQRARAVAAYLVGRGIPAGQLEVVAMGAAEPVADNSTELGRRLNRRIEFELEERQSPAGSARLSAEKSSTSKTSVEPGGITLPTARSP